MYTSAVYGTQSNTLVIFPSLCGDYANTYSRRIASLWHNITVMEVKGIITIL